MTELMPDNELDGKLSTKDDIPSLEEFLLSCENVTISVGQFKYYLSFFEMTDGSKCQKIKNLLIGRFDESFVQIQRNPSNRKFVFQILEDNTVN